MLAAQGQWSHLCTQSVKGFPLALGGKLVRPFLLKDRYVVLVKRISYVGLGSSPLLRERLCRYYLEW